MEIYCHGTANIKHAETGLVYKIDCSELDWDAVGGDERSMGTQIQYEASIDHPELGKLSWELWEYPVGIQNYNKTNIGEHKLIKDFDYGLQHSNSSDD